MAGNNPFGPGLGYDPARMAQSAKPKVITNTRIELPPDAYRLEGQTVSYFSFFSLYFYCHHSPMNLYASNALELLSCQHIRSEFAAGEEEATPKLNLS